MTSHKNRGYNRRKIPVSSKDPRYQRIYYDVTKKGKPLDEVLQSLGISVNITPAALPSHSQEDPTGFHGMVLDELCLINGNLLSIKSLLQKLVDRENAGGFKR